MGDADDLYFRETAHLVAESQKLVAEAWAESRRVALNVEETKKRIAESLELIKAAKKLGTTAWS